MAQTFLASKGARMSCVSLWSKNGMRTRLSASFSLRAVVQRFNASNPRLMFVVSLKRLREA